MIGNGAYSFVPLRNTANDAADMAVALRECGFEVMTRTDASRRDMHQSIRDFGNKLKEGGVGLFYYAGHGVQVNGDNFLVPVGADIEHEDELEDYGVLMSSVLRKMETAENRLNIVVLDACRNNPYAGSFRSSARGLAAFPPVKGTIIAYATSANAVAADGEGRNGLFTSKLLKYLKAPGLTIEAVFKNVGREVARETDDRQRPYLESGFYGDFYFNPGDQQAMSFSTPGSVASGSDALVATNSVRPSASIGDAAAGEVFVRDYNLHIDRFEVTNADYAEFLNSVGNRTAGDALWLAIDDEDALIEQHQDRFESRPGFEDHPVVEVTWYGARAYCEWRGRRLPTAGEWRRAAFGGDGRSYPWGNEMPDEAGHFRANYDQGPFAEDGYPRTAPVGSYEAGASPYGALDMAGNVWEWTATTAGENAVQLGGSWFNDVGYFDQEWNQPQWLASENTGFRCARDAR